MRIRREPAGAYLLGASVAGVPYWPAWLVILACVAGVGLIEWARHDEGEGD